MIIAISGHRKIQGKIVNEKHSPWLNSQIDEIIARAKAKEPPVFLCGGAIGLDRFFAWRAVNLDCQFDLYLPYLGFDDNHSAEDQADLSMLMTKARRVLYLDEPGYDPRKLTNRNLTMLDQSDFLIAVMTRRGSGTSHTVDEALKRGLRVYLINPLTEKAEWRRSDVQPVPDDAGGRVWTKRTAPRPVSIFGPKWTVKLVSDLDPDREQLDGDVQSQSGHWIPEYLEHKYPAWQEGSGSGEEQPFSEGDRDLYLLAVQRGLLQDHGATELSLGTEGAVPLHDLPTPGDGHAEGDDPGAERGYAELSPGEVYKVVGPFIFTKPAVTSDMNPAASMSASGLTKQARMLSEGKKKRSGGKRNPAEWKIREDQEKLEKWQQAT